MYDVTEKITLPDGSEITPAEAIGRPARDFAAKGRRQAMWPVTTGVQEDGSVVILMFDKGDGSLNKQVCTGAVVIDTWYTADTITGLLRSYDKWASPKQMEEEG
jgi:hypothetical protein